MTRSTRSCTRAASRPPRPPRWRARSPTPPEPRRASSGPTIAPRSSASSPTWRPRRSSSATHMRRCRRVAGLRIPPAPSDSPGETMSSSTAPAPADAFSRAAIVHDWLTVPGGSEKVVLELLQLLPRAEVFTSVYDPEPWREKLAGVPVHASFLDRIPGARTQYPKLLPLMTRAFESFDLADFDLVVSSSHSCAKNVLTGPGTPHVCYCHTPMRHAWEPRYLEAEPMGLPARLAAR